MSNTAYLFPVKFKMEESSQTIRGYCVSCFSVQRATWDNTDFTTSDKGLKEEATRNGFFYAEKSAAEKAAKRWLGIP